jgi:hypothetical protein
MNQQLSNSENGDWPDKPEVFPDLMTPIEAAMFLRLDQTGHNPENACRTLDYWRNRGELRATKFDRPYLTPNRPGFFAWAPSDSAERNVNAPPAATTATHKTAFLLMTTPHFIRHYPLVHLNNAAMRSNCCKLSNLSPDYKSRLFSAACRQNPDLLFPEPTQSPSTSTQDQC